MALLQIQETYNDFWETCYVENRNENTNIYEYSISNQKQHTPQKQANTH